MQHNGTPWRTLAMVLGLWSIPAQAATEPPGTQNQVLVDFFVARLTEFGWGKLALIAAGAVVASFFVSLGVARVLAGSLGTFRNTVKYFLLSFFLGLLVSVVAGGLGWFCITTNSMGGTLIVGFFAAVAMLIIAFAVPIVIFDIGIFRALALNVLIAVGNAVVQTAAAGFIPTPFADLQGKSNAEIAQIIGEWNLKRRQKELTAERSQPVASALTPADVAAEAQRLYAELQQAREKLDVNDQAAVQAFNARVAEYNAVKARLAPAASGTQ